MIVSGKNKANRPFFFAGVDGERVEFAAMGVGKGDLEGRDLDAFNVQVKAGIIEQIEVKPEPEKAVELDVSDLQAEYLELSGKDADKRWSEKRLSDEIAKIKKG